MTMTARAHLAQYARDELRGDAVYRGYRPRTALLDQVAHLLPSAHVLVVSGTWCGDCRREVPKFARIMEHLPDAWTIELRQDDDDTRRQYEVLAIPSFIVLDAPDGLELGRIIESPTGDEGIEGDLLAIARHANQQHAQRLAGVGT
jgi:thiol-disulfide isomerase/thioredoxin